MPTPDQYLSTFPPLTQMLAHRLRDLIQQTLPEATEQVRLGWQIIGLYVPGQKGPLYFGFIIPHTNYVTLGFTYGLLLPDPHQRLLGAREKLKQVRYLSFRTEKEIHPRRLIPLIKQAATLALMPTALRVPLLTAARIRERL
jgi:hypothetical protein